MSMRTTWELSVEVLSGPPITIKQLESLAKVLGEGNHVAVIEGPDSGFDDQDRLDLGDGGKSFSGMMYDCHPEEYGGLIKIWSKHHCPETRMRVDEYCQECTEMVEAGRQVYDLLAGKRTKPSRSCVVEIVAGDPRVTLHEDAEAAMKHAVRARQGKHRRVRQGRRNDLQEFSSVKEGDWSVHLVDASDE